MDKGFWEAFSVEGMCCKVKMPLVNGLFAPKLACFWGQKWRYADFIFLSRSGE